MKKREVILVLALLITVPLCLGFYAQKEREKNTRLKIERMLISSIEKKIKLEKDLNKKIQEQGKAIAQLLGRLKSERKIRSMLISKMQTKTSSLNLAMQVKKGVELEKIVVRSVTNVEGKILAVDRQNAVVVLNIGRDNDIKTGDRLSVYRDSKLIADIEVILVQDKISAATIVSEDKSMKLAINDLVKVF